MIFTESDYKKIQEWLTQHSLKDSDFSKIELAELNEEVNNITVPVITYSVPNNTYNNNLVSITDLDAYYSPLYLRKDHNYVKEEKPFTTYWADNKNQVVYKTELSAPTFYSVTKKPNGSATYDYCSPLIELKELSFGTNSDPYGGRIQVTGWESKSASDSKASPTLDTAMIYNGIRVAYKNTTEVGLGIGIPTKIGITENLSKSDAITGLYIGEDVNHGNNKKGVYIEGKKDNDVLNAQGGVRKDFTEFMGPFDITSGSVEKTLLANYEVATNKELGAIYYKCKGTQDIANSTVLVHQTSAENKDGTINVIQHINMNNIQRERVLTFSKSNKQLVGDYPSWKKAPVVKTTSGEYPVDEYNDVVIDTRIIAE